MGDTPCGRSRTAPTDATEKGAVAAPAKRATGSRLSGTDDPDHTQAGDAGKEEIVAHHKRRRRRRAGIKGCCGMCMLRKTDGRRNHRLLTRQELASLLSEQEYLHEQTLHHHAT